MGVTLFDEDTISRQAVKDALYNAIRIRELNYRQIVECIDELPSVAPVEIEPKLFINTDEVVKKLCNIIIQRESKEYYSIRITANERCENVIADIGHSDKELSYIADEMPSMECVEWLEAISMAIEALQSISALSADLKAVDRDSMDEKTLIGFNMAVALMNKHLGGDGE